MNHSLSINQSLIETNILALQEGIKNIEGLESGQYVQGFKPAFESTIGAHYRHVVEHYRCFFAQMDNRIFCYDHREREQSLECDALCTIEALNELIRQFGEIPIQAFSQAYTLVDEQAQAPVETNLHRELLFLQSHTVHHYAIIAAITRALGNQTEADFGVAIATRSYQKCSGSRAANIESSAADHSSPESKIAEG